MKHLLLIVIAATVTGCGDVKKGLDKMTDQNPMVPNSSPVITPSQTFTPGSYFKVMTDVGNGKDTRVFEFQYLSSGKFIITQTSFPGGNLASSSFHKKSGTFIEQAGQIFHTTTYDTCNDLSFQQLYISGDKKNSVNINWRGLALNLYSYGTWSLPPDIANQIPDAVEDVGCVKFKDQ